MSKGKNSLDRVPYPPELYPSPTPRQFFPETLAAQQEELKINPLMRRFAASRQSLAADPYRPAYHFVSPENMLNDPNGLCCWQGRWHLFYQAYPPDEFPEAADIKKRRQHWGHTVSDDLVHWHDLPYAIYPGVEKCCFSGGTLVEDNRVVAFYPGIKAGQMVATSHDPLLLNWQKLGGQPVKSSGADAAIWKEGDTYCGLLGGTKRYGEDGWWPMMHLWTSTDLTHWEPQGEFLEPTPLTGRYDDGACPSFVPIGDKYALFFFSHRNGGQYFLGDYDQQKRRFKPYDHGRFNHDHVAPGGVHAPSAAVDGQGGVINILNINDGKQNDDWDQIMSLAQHLSLGPDKRLRIEPVTAVATLRGAHRYSGATRLAANQELVLDDIGGDTLELEVEIDPQAARWVQINVLRSPDAQERTSINFYNYDRHLSYWYFTPGEICLDGTLSSQSPEAWVRPPERAVMQRAGQPLQLRIFVDRSVVEVFANKQQYLAMRVYPERQDSRGVSLYAHGQDALLKSLDAWQMRSIWT